MLTAVIRNTVWTMEKNPILNKMLILEEHSLLRQKFSSRAGQMKDFLVELVLELQNLGILIHEKKEVLAGAVRSLLFLTFHKEGIGNENYADTIELLIQAVAQKIINKGSQS
jgi:hypothetical protein